ncbi:MAG: ATP-binding protein, partial [Jaaginema sp. PMC 1079.18]|nr:ATP-binding protein [Jaaginema sp. PMC 1079.18]
GQYNKALIQLLTINLKKERKYHANFIRLNLGRLYARLHQYEQSTQLIDQAIANSDDNDKDKTLLYAARSSLAQKNGREEAVKLLRQIEETSPRYQEAMHALALNANPQTAYELFADSEKSFGDTEMLYRAMYHKIGNEVAILKSIAYRLLRKIQNKHPLVGEIARELEELQESINQKRAVQKAAMSKIPNQDYQQLIEIISETAHNISDEVNNQLAAIESKTRRAMRKLSAETVQHEQFSKLLKQLELTQTALNDLKSINEGIKIRRHRFCVHELFEKWKPENWSSIPRIQKAKIKLSINNPDAEFDGDEEKIKSILNELVENSLKHNSKHRNLIIRMSSQDIWNPQDIACPTIPGDRKFLYIQFIDNGQGIPYDKKEWIFQPLHTTSSEDKGSGLGLFIARKTLQKMGGSIREVGEEGKGVRFQIYLPYLASYES